MDQTTPEAVSTYKTKTLAYYYLGSMLATLAILLFISLLGLSSLMNDPTGLVTVLCLFGALALIIPAVACMHFKRRQQLMRLDYINIAILRIATFFVMMSYANAKLLNGQLNVFYYALDTKLNDLDDIFMVWAFYGKSSFVQVMLGLMELIPAILLLFRRTTFIGALLMLPVNANILMINSLYRVSPFTLTESALLLCFNIYIIYSYKDEIMEIVKRTLAAPTLFTRKPGARRLVTGAKILVLLFIGFLLVKTIYKSKSVQHEKAHPITGGYELVNLMQDDVPAELSAKGPDHYTKLYFERSWVSGFATDKNNATQNVHFTFWDRDSLKIAVNAGSWDYFIEEPASVFKGTYHQASDGSLLLKGRQGGHSIEAKYKKLPLRNYDYWW